MPEFLIQHQFWAVIAGPVARVRRDGRAARYTVHPGSLNKADSVAYDTLLIAEKSIDEAKTGDASAALNTLIQA